MLDLTQFFWSLVSCNEEMLDFVIVPYGVIIEPKTCTHFEC